MTAGLTTADLTAIEAHLRADVIFTAHARTDVLALLAEVRQLRHALAVARHELDCRPTTVAIPAPAVLNGASR